MTTNYSFILYISAANCKYEVRLNDFPVFNEYKGHRINLGYPVNQLMKGTLITLGFSIRPIEGKDMLDETPEFLLELRYGISSSETYEVIYRYNYKFNGTPHSHLVDLKEVVVTDIGIKPAWSEGEELKLSEAVLSDLYSTYRQLWSAFRNQNLDQLREFFRVRDYAYSRAFYLDPENRQKESIAVYEKYLGDPDYKLYDLQLQHFTPKVACLGKVIYMEEKDGFHPVFFLKHSKKGSFNIPIFFSRIENKLLVTL